MITENHFWGSPRALWLFLNIRLKKYVAILAQGSCLDGSGAVMALGSIAKSICSIVSLVVLAASLSGCGGSAEVACRRRLLNETDDANETEGDFPCTCC